MEPEVPGGPAGGASLRFLAVRGALVVGLRGILSRLIALAGTIVLARSLSAEHFGIFVLGAALMISIGAVVQAGLGAGLIRRAAEPTLVELQAVVAVNGMLMIGVVAVTAAVCAEIGGQAVAVALMVALIPLTALRTPGVIAFERALSYRSLAQVEILETTALYGLGAVLVVAGMGLTGIAVAASVRAVAGTYLMVRAAPHGIVWPRPSRSVVRELAGFAGRYQGLAIINLLRDQGANLAIAAVGGVTMLGVYAVGTRLLQAPQILLEALFRVSFPAMSRLRDQRGDPRSAVERVLKGVALSTGLIVAPLAAASAPLIPQVFGERWSGAAAVVPPICLALMIGGPVSVAAAGYLFAADGVGVVVRSALLHTLAWFVVAVPLLTVLGVVATGLGTLAASVVEGIVLGRAVRKRTGARVLAALVIPMLAATAAAGAGAGTIAVVAVAGALQAPLAAIVAATAYAIILLVLQRADVVSLARLVRGAVGPAPA